MGKSLSIVSLTWALFFQIEGAYCTDGGVHSSETEGPENGPGDFLDGYLYADLHLSEQLPSDCRTDLLL